MPACRVMSLYGFTVSLYGLAVVGFCKLELFDAAVIEMFVLPRCAVFHSE